jgi:hypothetical protein
MSTDRWLPRLLHPPLQRAWPSRPQLLSRHGSRRKSPLGNPILSQLVESEAPSHPEARALLAWVLSPPVAVVLMSGLGLGLARAWRAGLRRPPAQPVRPR